MSKMHVYNDNVYSKRNSSNVWNTYINTILSFSIDHNFWYSIS